MSLQNIVEVSSIDMNICISCLDDVLRGIRVSTLMLHKTFQYSLTIIAYFMDCLGRCLL